MRCAISVLNVATAKIQLTMQRFKNQNLYFHSRNMILLGETVLTTAEILTMKQLSCMAIHFLD